MLDCCRIYSRFSPSLSRRRLYSPPSCSLTLARVTKRVCRHQRAPPPSPPQPPPPPPPLPHCRTCRCRNLLPAQASLAGSIAYVAASETLANVRCRARARADLSYGIVFSPVVDNRTSRIAIHLHLRLLQSEERGSNLRCKFPVSIRAWNGQRRARTKNNYSTVLNGTSVGRHVESIVFTAFMLRLSEEPDPEVAHAWYRS